MPVTNEFTHEFIDFHAGHPDGCADASDGSSFYASSTETSDSEWDSSNLVAVGGVAIPDHLRSTPMGQGVWAKVQGPEEDYYWGRSTQHTTWAAPSGAEAHLGHA